MLKTNMNVNDGVLYVTVEGRLDALTSRTFEKELEAAFDGITGITIDCAGLEYISSAGLRTILVAEQYLEDNDYDDVKVINVNDTIAEIFEETGFTDLVNLVR